MIDLRSDTVTQPTQEMRDAMYRAEVGDDVYSDDPEINELEKLAARMLGKEDAMLVTSGTQGNIVSVMTHTRRGEAIILSPGCHIAVHENGAYGMFAGVSPVYAGEDGGVVRPESVRELIRDDSDIHEARTGLICMENAYSNGNVIPVVVMAEVHKIAREHGLPVHLDGARLFNAAAYLGVEVKELTRYCDSVMCCMSKGLCAPVGSVVAGESDFIRRARRFRKALGGGMRQAGFLAAAGKLAFTDMTQRLKDDHDNARYLAEKLGQLPGMRVKMERVKINMVFFELDRPKDFVDSLPDRLLEKGIRILPQMAGEIRLVTHNGVSRADCEAVISAFGELLA